MVQTMNGTYTFDLDDVSLTNGISLTFYAEGLALGNQKINLNLLNADGVTIAKDRINISVGSDQMGQVSLMSDPARSDQMGQVQYCSAHPVLGFSLETDRLR